MFCYFIAASCPPLSPFFGKTIYNQPVVKGRFYATTIAYISCHSGNGVSLSTCESSRSWSEPTDCKGDSNVILTVEML